MSQSVIELHQRLAVDDLGDSRQAAQKPLVSRVPSMDPGANCGGIGDRQAAVRIADVVLRSNPQRNRRIFLIKIAGKFGAASERNVIGFLGRIRADFAGIVGPQRLLPGSIQRITRIAHIA